MSKRFITCKIKQEPLNKIKFSVKGLINKVPPDTHPCPESKRRIQRGDHVQLAEFEAFTSIEGIKVFKSDETFEAFDSEMQE